MFKCISNSVFLNTWISTNFVDLHNFYLSMVRYWGSLEHPMALAHRDELKSGEAIILEISPKYFSTWDY
jgi:hypothetical protein